MEVELGVVIYLFFIEGYIVIKRVGSDGSGCKWVCFCFILRNDYMLIGEVGE